MRPTMRTICGLSTVVVLSMAACDATSDTARDRDEVAGLDRAFQAAVKRNDAAAMDEILHDRYFLVLGNGAVVTRDELLREARDGDIHYERQDEVPGTQTVRVWGDAAVVTAKLWIKGTGISGAFDRKLWFSDTYVRTPGGWRYAFGQASLRLPEEPAMASATDVDAVSRAFDDAQFRKDAAALDRFLAADFRFVRGSGKFTGRDEFIAIFSDPGLHFEPFVITDREVVKLGPEVAIVSADGRMSGTDGGGRPFAEHFRYADTFAYRDGRWQVVYVQVTPIPAAE